MQMNTYVLEIITIQEISKVTRCISIVFKTPQYGFLQQ